MTTRNVGDAYYTPPTLAAAIAARVALLVAAPAAVLEPSSGGGAFVRAARATWPTAKITAVDVFEGCRIFASPADAFVCSSFLEYGGGPFDLIIGNPPYNEAEDHVSHALALLKPGGLLAFLLRGSFLGSEGRNRRIWASGLGAYVAPISPRPSFTGGGTDSAEYCLFGWVKGSREPSRIGRPIFWNETAGAAAGGTG